MPITSYLRRVEDLNNRQCRYSNSIYVPNTKHETDAEYELHQRVEDSGEEYSYRYLLSRLFRLVDYAMN